MKFYTWSLHILSCTLICLSVSNAGTKINLACGLHIRSSNCIALFIHGPGISLSWFYYYFIFHRFHLCMLQERNLVIYMLSTHIYCLCVDMRLSEWMKFVNFVTLWFRIRCSIMQNVLSILQKVDSLKKINYKESKISMENLLCCTTNPWDDGLPECFLGFVVQWDANLFYKFQSVNL